jgi:hypothetical protein
MIATFNVVKFHVNRDDTQEVEALMPLLVGRRSWNIQNIWFSVI